MGDGTIKALTLWQPWASLLAMGDQVKRHETRGWFTSHRGPLLIHAASRRATHDADCEQVNRVLRSFSLPVPAEYPCGAIVGAGLVTSCASTSGFFAADPDHELDEAFGNWSPGRYAWALSHVLAFDPVPCQGHQALWTPDDGVLADCLINATRAAALKFPDVPDVAGLLISNLFPVAGLPSFVTEAVRDR